MKIPRDEILHITAQGVGELKAEWVGELIRCQDCKYYARRDEKVFHRGADCLRKGGITTINADGFCSYAEKGEE